MRCIRVQSAVCVTAVLSVSLSVTLMDYNVPLFTKPYKLVPAVDWEGNRMSGVALTMRHRHSGISTYGLNGLGKGDEHPT